MKGGLLRELMREFVVPYTIAAATLAAVLYLPTILV